MKKFKLLTLLMTVIMAVTVFAGCPDKGQKVDPFKTQLYLGVYDGGLGTQWTKQVAAKFEEMYKDESFENGKTGVEVIITGKKAQYEPGVLIPGIQTGLEKEDIYYTASSLLSQFIDGGVTADVTAAVSQKVYTESGELGGTAKSILDRMEQTYVKTFNFGTLEQPGYYGVPFEDAILGFVYDHDLFVENGYYNTGNGPDGLPNTYDDGLPATMNEFYDLLTLMVQDGVIPFTLTGMNSFYFAPLTTALVAQNDGIEQAELNRTYSGVFTSAVNPANNGITITPENAYLLADQKGKLEALKFLRQLVSSPNYYSVKAFYTSQTHTEAQAEFVRSKKIGSKRIAMILEGEWWENEARDFFTEMSTQYNDPTLGYGQRDFRYLALPKIPGQAMDTSAYGGFSNGTLCFVNKYSEKTRLTSLWLQFALSNQSLATFTTVTGAQQAYEYDLTPNQLEGMTKFAQNLWKLRRADNAVVVRTPQAGAHPFRTYGSNDAMGGNGGALISKVGTAAAYKEPLTAFYNNATLSAQQYFDGMKVHYSQSVWQTAYNQYLASSGN